MGGSRGRVGLVVNPVAGIGGEVGLGGSDGAELQSEARARGGEARAPERAARFLRELGRIAPDARVVTAAGPLGGEWARDAELVGAPPSQRTTAEDTARAASELCAGGVEVLVLVGGDGTARDVLAGAGPDQLCLGVAAGVKMHSGVFAVTPEDAAQQVLEVLEGRGRPRRRDVVDLDEESRRGGVLATSVYGVMLVPGHDRVQRGKRSPAHGGDVDARGVAEEIRRRAGGAALVFGPGTTVAGVAREFGVESSLLGFDLLEPEGVCHAGVGGAELERLTESGGFAVVLSPVGGQGLVIGRGNHQLTARLLSRLRPEDLLLVSGAAKLGELAGRLRIDAPTRELNAKFRGVCRVLVGDGETAVVRIE